MEFVVRFIAFCVYVAGIVIAKGFWGTLFAVIIPPYSWYIVIEKALQYCGVIG